MACAPRESSTAAAEPAALQDGAAAAAAAPSGSAANQDALSVEAPPAAARRGAASAAVTRRLYVSHLLSTWNARSFEFGAVLFLAAVFPGTQLYMSVYGLVCAASAIAWAPAVGRAIDRRGRLGVVRFSIVGQRVAVVLSCVGFYCALTVLAHSKAAKLGILAVTILLACLEKNCSVMNLVAVERDWVVVIAGDDEPFRRVLNARMRRIDLICKLGGPLFISLVDGASPRIAVLLTLGLNIVSIPIEYLAIARVYALVPALQEPKPPPPASPARRLLHPTWPKTLYALLHFYLTHPACPPSFALALLYLTVLSLSGQMVTYLLAAGLSAFSIALIRTLSVAFELSATWAAPRAQAAIGPARAALWFLSWQAGWLAAAVVFFFTQQQRSSLVAAAGLAAGTILSRTGLWGYDLCAQTLIQDEVAGPRRGAFSATEAGLQNAFELASYVLTIVFASPAQFRWPVLVSALAVFGAAGLYGRFLRRRRGHLLHVPACVKGGHDGDG